MHGIVAEVESLAYPGEPRAHGAQRRTCRAALIDLDTWLDS
jgi:hypothetical protein